MVAEGSGGGAPAEAAKIDNPSVPLDTLCSPVLQVMKEEFADDMLKLSLLNWLLGLLKSSVIGRGGGGAANPGGATAAASGPRRNLACPVLFINEIAFLNLATVTSAISLQSAGGDLSEI